MHSSKLEPALTDAEVFDVIKCATDSLFALPPGGVKKGKSETYEEQMRQEQLMESTMASLNNLLIEILNKDFSPNGFGAIFKVRRLHEVMPLYYPLHG